MIVTQTMLHEEDISKFLVSKTWTSPHCEVVDGKFKVLRFCMTLTKYEYVIFTTKQVLLDQVCKNKVQNYQKDRMWEFKG